MDRTPTSQKKVVFERRNGYLHAKIPVSNLDRSVSLEYLTDIILQCSEKRDKRLLIEGDIPVSKGAHALIAVLGDVVRMCGGMKIAFLNVHPVDGKAMPVTFDRGSGDGADYQFFTDGKKAKDWIVAGKVIEWRMPDQSIHSYR